MLHLPDDATNNTTRMPRESHPRGHPCISEDRGMFAYSGIPACGAFYIYQHKDLHYIYEEVFVCLEYFSKDMAKEKKSTFSTAL